MYQFIYIQYAAVFFKAHGSVAPSLGSCICFFSVFSPPSTNPCLCRPLGSVPSSSSIQSAFRPPTLRLVPRLSSSPSDFPSTPSLCLTATQSVIRRASSLVVDRKMMANDHPPPALTSASSSPPSSAAAALSLLVLVLLGGGGPKGNDLAVGAASV